MSETTLTCRFFATHKDALKLSWIRNNNHFLMSKSQQGTAAFFFAHPRKGNRVIPQHFSILKSTSLHYDWGLKGYFPHWINTLLFQPYSCPTSDQTRICNHIVLVIKMSLSPSWDGKLSLPKNPCSSRVLSLFQVHLLLKCSLAHTRCQYEPIMSDCSGIWYCKWCLLRHLKQTWNLKY